MKVLIIGLVVIWAVVMIGVYLFFANERIYGQRK